ncbi:MAG: DNA recombination protein RmuC [Patescibacteria group bacterium]|nr:DNA recombination protein RmuC [Patescibacteria group bacterium]
MSTQLVTILIIIMVIISFGLGIIFLIISKKIGQLKSPESQDAQKLMLEVMENLRHDIQDGHLKNRQEIQTRLDKINDQLSRGMSDSSKTMQKQFAQSAQIIQEVTSRLTKLDDTNKQVLDFSKQLQSLENILKNPKQRGILGEYYLEALLSQILQPGQYKLQYKFANGEIVDAAVFIDKQIVPIDAKFSLEKYNQITETHDKEKRERLEKSFKADLKERIDETAKYIRPEENTTDFAIMFIPAEGIFYNLLIYKVGTVNLNTEDLIKYAFSKRVMITSPTSFFAYLQTILQGLKSLKMEQSVREIVKKIGQLGKHLNSYETYLQKLGNNLGTTVNMYNHAYKEFGKIDKDVYKITDGKAGGSTETLAIDKPTDLTQ